MAARIQWQLVGFNARVATQSTDGVQQLHTVPKRGDAKLLQVLVREARENRLVYVILAEDRLVLAEAEAPQPDHDVHDSAPNSGLLHIIVPSGGSVHAIFADAGYAVCAQMAACRC